MIIESSVHMNMAGYYKLAVVDDATDEVVFEQKDWNKNLILNTGMNGMITRSMCASWTYAIAGIGTRPNKFTSQGSQVSQSGVTVFMDAGGVITDWTAASSSYSSILEPGDEIEWANGSHSLVSSVDSPVLATVNSASDNAWDTFTIYKTSQTGLESELKRTVTYVADGCGRTFTMNTGSYRRTWDFTAETTTIPYTEIGTSWAASGNGTTFSRMLLPEPFYVNSGQRLRIYYQMIATYGPRYPIQISASIGGWPRRDGVGFATNTSASYQMYVLTSSGAMSTPYNYFVSAVQANISGETVGNATANNTIVMEPYGSGHAWISSNGDPHGLFGTPLSRVGTDVVGGIGLVLKTQGITSNVFEVYKSASFTEAHIASDRLRSFGLGYQDGYGQSYAAARACFQVLMEQTQSKQNTQTLTLFYKYTWGRVLSE